MKLHAFDAAVEALSLWGTATEILDVSTPEWFTIYKCAVVLAPIATAWGVVTWRRKVRRLGLR
ncbi:hypothetical protein [Bradyrhizobium sp. Ec3.3]|uniref:hypothetical protein n=1 Tax=Bradyrhizobium sp. Ec3.3 TaxID=189753 RepID=UPI0003F7C223|nr:hypothetical protein [Bradyrhizobium sp. Ec3.3]